MRNLLRHSVVLLTVAVLFFARSSQAGVAECNGIRLEESGSCEFRGSAGCEASCKELKMNIACAARLHAECRGGCDLDVTEDCSKDCETQCNEQCDAGIEINCEHNCFEECHGSCDGKCAGAEDKEQCVAGCEATCDGECDVRCKPLKNASCYDHCRECCHGSCRAIVNMDCQLSCQAEAHAGCEASLRADCDASCEVDGAIFCDGEFVASGAELGTCSAALAREGIAKLDISADIAAELDSAGLLDGEGKVNVDAVEEKVKNGAKVGSSADSKAGGGCALGPAAFKAPGGEKRWPGTSGVLLALAWLARRKER